MRRARTTYRLDDPAQQQLVAADPTRLATGEEPILIDEWQRLPESWDIIRRAVDDDPRPSRFLLTGSATPIDPPTHSGAGRIVRLRMRPLSLAERGVDTPTVSLRQMLSERKSPIAGATNVGLADYAKEVVQSGFPAFRGRAGRCFADSARELRRANRRPGIR